MPQKAPTIRSLARKLGLAPATVSDALRGTGRVDPRTAERVRRAARLAGYHINPLTTALMSEMRRARAALFRGSLAIVDLVEPNRPPAGVFHHRMIAGAKQCAGELGFELHEFVIRPDETPLPRLESILVSRGIAGIVVLPSWSARDLSQLDWNRFSGIYTDYVFQQPALHSVCTDHFHSITTAMELLLARGYRRPGLVLNRRRSERIHHRVLAAFRAFADAHMNLRQAPVLLTDEEPCGESEFKRWFKRHQPDVVLSHFDTMVTWMEQCHARVPRTHGFVHLNIVFKQRPCAGLDFRPEEIGARAVEKTVTQLYRNERGIPKWATTTTVPACWADGPTIRGA